MRNLVLSPRQYGTCHRRCNHEAGKESISTYHQAEGLCEHMVLVMKALERPLRVHEAMHPVESEVLGDVEDDELEGE